MKSKNNQQKIFSTDSLPLASFLLAKGCKLISLDKSNPTRVLFEFEVSEKQIKLTEDFWRWQGSVEPREFFAKQRELKNMIFSKSYKN